MECTLVDVDCASPSMAAAAVHSELISLEYPDCVSLGVQPGLVLVGMVELERPSVGVVVADVVVVEIEPAACAMMIAVYDADTEHAGSDHVATMVEVLLLLLVVAVAVAAAAAGCAVCQSCTECTPGFLWLC